MSEDTSIIGFMPTNVSSNIRKQMPTIIIGSLTLIASFAWNDGFKALIDQYVPDEYKKGRNAWFKILYAFILTTIVILVISLILSFSPKT